MKNKKLLFLAAVVFAFVAFYPSGAKGETCAEFGGICSPSGTCGSGWTQRFGKTCPNTTDACCVKVDCAGICSPAGCSGGYTAVSGKTCYNQTDDCCVASTAPTVSTVYTCISNGGVCKGDVCATLDGFESASGTCPSGESCCKATSSKGTYSIELEKDASSSGTMWNVQSVGGFGLPSGKVSGIIESLVSWILGIFGFLGIITFVVAGIFYLTAAGDADMEKKAKNAMKMGIIGIVVGLVGLVIIKAVDIMLNAGTSF